MKDQRWPGDYETVPQEFAHSLHQEQLGMAAANLSRDNDYLTIDNVPGFDRYQRDEHNPSWATQLDTVGMQPHSREYLERHSTCIRSERKFHMMCGEIVDYTPGIQFTDTP